MKDIKVKLINDLTKYHPLLEIGVEGYTVGTYDFWSRTSDRFVGVCFPGIKTLDVLWEGLEIIDEEYLKKKKEKKEIFFNELKTAYNVVKHVGPRGGFKYLCYSYKDSNGKDKCGSSVYKEESQEIEDILYKYNIDIKVVIQ